MTERKLERATVPMCPEPGCGLAVIGTLSKLDTTMYRCRCGWFGYIPIYGYYKADIAGTVDLLHTMADNARKAGIGDDRGKLMDRLADMLEGKP